MRLPSCLVVAGLALGGCSQTGQNDMMALVAPVGSEAVQGSTIGASTEAQPSPAPAGGGFALASFFAPTPQVQVQVVAQAEPELIPGDFVAPENPPLPPPRPDYGDRIPANAIAEAPAAAPAASAIAATAPAMMNTPPAPPAPQTMARAEAASLGAYEFKSAGVPLPAGGLRADAASFAPATFEVAGVPARASAGASGQKWRAAYDTVETECFPEELRRALDKIATHFNSEVLVTSGMRERGRRGSLHRSCKAADIRVVGVSPGEVARVARTMPGVNGVGTYRRVAVTHVDVRQERFAWRW